MLKKIYITILFLISVFPLYADWENCYFIGTPNNWEVTPMKKVDDNTWSIVAKFSGGDKDGGPRFKISRYPDWSESYPAEDYRVEKES